MKGWRGVVVVILAAAAVGFSIFLALAWQAVDVEKTDPATAMREIENVRGRFGDARPLVTFDAAGKPEGTGRAAAKRAAEPARNLHILAFRASEGGLVRAQVPLWFLDLKEPVVEAVLRPTGVDLKALGLTAAQLEAAGPTLVFDVEKPNGDRALVWTE